MKISGSKCMLNRIATIATNSGTSLAIVVMMLTLAASFTPRLTKSQQIQTTMDAPMTEGRLLPSPNRGTKYEMDANRSVV